MPSLTTKTSKADRKAAQPMVRQPHLRNPRANSPTISNKPILNPGPIVEAQTNIEQRITFLKSEINRFGEEIFRHTGSKDIRVELLNAIYIRYPQALLNSCDAVTKRHTVEVQYYLNNLSLGLYHFTEQYAEAGMDIFEFVETVELNKSHLTYLYYFGEHIQEKSEFHSACFDPVGKILAAPEKKQYIADILYPDQNLTFLMLAFDFIFRYQNQHNSLRRGGERQQAREAADWISSEIERIFLEEQAEEAEVKRNEKVKVIKAKTADEKFLEDLIEMGREIDQITTAVKSQDPVDIAKIVYKLIHLKNGKTKIEIAGKEIDVKDIIRAAIARNTKNAEEAVTLLVNTAIALISDTSEQISLDIKIIIIRLLNKLVNEFESEKQSAHDTLTPPLKHNELFEKVISELLSSYKKSSLKTVQGQVSQVKVEAFVSALKEWPEALPYLIQTHSQHYSLVRTFFARLLGMVGIKIKDVATRILKPLIYDLAKTPEGENEILSIHAYSPKTYPVNNFQGAEKPLRLHKLSRRLILPIVEKIIPSARELSFSSFIKKSKAIELREIIAEIARGLVSTKQPRKSLTSWAKKILAAAIKIQELSYLLKHERINEAEDLYENDVRPLTEKPPFELPALALIRNYFHGKEYLSRKDPFTRNLYKSHYNLNNDKISQILLDYHIVNITNRNIPSARRVKEVIDKYPEFKKALLVLIEQELQEHETIIASVIKYAYCLLAPQHGVSEKDIKRDLEATLLAEPNHNKPALALQMLPDAVKSQLDYHRRKHPLERMREIIIFKESKGDQEV